MIPPVGMLPAPERWRDRRDCAGKQGMTGMSNYRMRAWTIAIWLFALVLSGLNAPSAHAGGRVALVLGNGAYRFVPKLENPAGDARAIAALLKSIGFEVFEGEDLTRDKTTDLFLEFAARAEGADLAVFYYAGQGVSGYGEDYLLPVDADIKSATDLKLGAAIDIDNALSQTIAGAKVKMVFLDMSRTNPFVAASGRISIGAGLLPAFKADDSTVITWAAAPGGVALDGPKGGHSPFAQALLAHLAEPGVELQQVLVMVRADVHDLTDNRQLPWGETSLHDEIYLNPRAPQGR
jgi:uncharacterized caspase-like protein